MPIPSLRRGSSRSYIFNGFSAAVWETLNEATHTGASFFCTSVEKGDCLVGLSAGVDAVKF